MDKLMMATVTALETSTTIRRVLVLRMSARPIPMIDATDANYRLAASLHGGVG